MVLEFNVEFKNKETFEKGSFKMVLEGLAFKFEDIDSNKLINPFFTINENQIAIAKELFKEDSILLTNPKSLMNFTTGALTIEVTSEDL